MGNRRLSLKMGTGSRLSPILPCLLFLFGCLPAVAQPQPQSGPKYVARVDLVSLDVEVLDRRENPVLGLDQSAFIVKENGRVVPMTHFAELSNRPVSLAMVLDTSGMPREQLATAKQFVTRLAHTLSRDDELCLYTFDDRDAYLEVDFTRDRVPFLEALRNIDVTLGRKGALFKDLFGGTPKTGLAIDMALHRLRRGKNEKKAVLVVSNRFKGLGPATVEHIQESGFALLTLGFSNKSNWVVTLGGDEITKNSLLKQSGGRRFSADTEDIAGRCRAIAHSLKNHYSLGYLTEVGTGRQKRRTVEVGIPGTDYLVYARRSYIPPP